MLVQRQSTHVPFRHAGLSGTQGGRLQVQGPHPKKLYFAKHAKPLSTSAEARAQTFAYAMILRINLQAETE